MSAGLVDLDGLAQPARATAVIARVKNEWFIERTLPPGPSSVKAMPDVRPRCSAAWTPLELLQFLWVNTGNEGSASLDLVIAFD